MKEIPKGLRFLPVHLINPQADKERSIHVGEELESLIHTMGGEIVDRIIQKLDSPNNKTFIGKGKVTEVTERIQNKNVDIVVLNSTVKPGQVHELKKEFQKVNPNIDVWDRVDLILNIFDKHASTTEAKLQIELARMKYMGPRIYGMGYILSRQGGGIGTVGVGETNTELMKRHWRHEVKVINDKLIKIAQSRRQQLERRRRDGLKTISIVGYTNAGKSSLFNILTGKNVLVEDVLFATLDSSVGKMYIKEISSEVIITDTIGFIRNLPPRLIQAFKSTLLESISADVVFHVIDLSDPEVDSKIEVVNDILKDLGRNPHDSIYIFNKVDKIKNFEIKEFEKKYDKYSPLFISVKSGFGLDGLKTMIPKLLN